MTTLKAIGARFGGMTRDESTGIFYINTDNDIYTYDPCGDGSVTYLGVVSGLTGNAMRAIAFNKNNGLLYVFDDQHFIDHLYSIDINTLIATYIGSTNVNTIQCAEFDENGVLYAWSNVMGLVIVSLIDGSLTQVDPLYDNAISWFNYFGM